jgi:cysteine/glycine-rich protein
MPSCPRCNKSVYDAEGQSGGGKLWHPHCYTCRECNTRLSSTTLSEKGGELYCNPCYGKLFGPKGFGIGGATVVTGVSVADSNDNRCPSCSAKSQSAKFCGSCGAAMGKSSSSNNTIASNNINNRPPSPRGPSRQEAPISANSSRLHTTNNSSSSSLNSSNVNSKCGRCSKTVYFAEAVQGAGKQWHSECFTCKDCKKGLNSQTLADKDGVLYCNACYAKNFGPKGFGFAGGSGTTMAYTR